MSERRAPDWIALSRRALLHQAVRGDPLQALVLMLWQVNEAGRSASIAWRSDGGDALSWLEAAPCARPEALTGLSSRLRHARAAWQADGLWWLPLDHLSERLGVLCLAAAEGDNACDFEPACEAAAALLGLARSGGAALARAEAETLRAALRGAGTFVWQWDPASDELADFDEGYAMLGYPPGTLAPTQEHWNRLIHPDDLEANEAAYQRHARGETEHYEHIYRARGANGQWHWLHERGRVVDRAADGSPRRMLGTQVDITRQRELEARVSSAHQRLELIARNVPGVLYQFHIAEGQRARFPYVSDRCEALFGLTPQALMADAAQLFRLVEPEFREPVADSINASMRDGTMWRTDFPIRRPDGQLRWMRGTSSPRREPDGSTAWFGYIADVTDLRELESASRDKVAAEATSRAKTEFLSRMSHELRTPLNAVLGFAQLLEMARAPGLAEPHRRHVRLIREAGEHLLSMIGDLLDLTRIEAGQMPLQLEPVAIAPLAEECLALLQAQAAAGSVELLNAVVNGEGVHADRTRLKQVLLNLLSNAVKYNRAGGQVRLAAQSEQGMTRIDVTDTGVGIEAQHLAQLFEPFQRGAHRAGPIEGTGIGLAVSKSLAELMGGRIAVRSRPGEGSVFSVHLPSA